MSFLSFIEYQQRNLVETRAQEGFNQHTRLNINHEIQVYERLSDHFVRSCWPHNSDVELFNEGIDAELDIFLRAISNIDVPDLPSPHDVWDHYDVEASNEYEEAVRVREAAFVEITYIRNLAQDENAFADELARLIIEAEEC